MPVEVIGADFDQFVLGVERQLDSPKLVEMLGERLSELLVQGFESSGLVSRSGATVAALSFVGNAQPELTGWSIGVGNADMAGQPDDAAPRGTLQQFFEDNPSIKPTPWFLIPQSYKDKLESMRRSGMYGGDRLNARYLWVQDRGDASVYISPHHYIDGAVLQWQIEAPDIIEGYFNGSA